MKSMFYTAPGHPLGNIATGELSMAPIVILKLAEHNASHNYISL